jgi:hypothetical protein
MLRHERPVQEGQREVETLRSLLSSKRRDWVDTRRAPPAPPAPLEAGASQADVDKALLALPEGMRNQTTVVKWKPDFTYDTLRKGYQRSGLL